MDSSASSWNEELASCKAWDIAASFLAWAASTPGFWDSLVRNRYLLGPVTWPDWFCAKAAGVANKQKPATGRQRARTDPKRAFIVFASLGKKNKMELCFRSGMMDGGTGA